MSRWRLVTACAVTCVAFALYHATLLPGFDFGDTGSFQTMVGSPIITPRDGYPLYFAIGGRKMGNWFWALGLAGVAVNIWGAIAFN